MRLHVFCLAAVLTSLPVAETAKVNEPDEGRPKAKPKWADPDAWWEKLKRGLPEATVRNILGEPLYISKDSGGARWYYQYRPKITDGMNAKFFSAPKAGYVYFEDAVKVPRGRSHPAPIYVLAGWVEPDWTAVEAGKYDLPEPKRNLKPIRELAPYEKQDAWNQLRFGINQQSVQRILGKPARVKRNILFEEYYYDLPCGGATLRFESDALVSWSEPCWLAVELELYEEVKDSTADKPGAAQEQ